MYGYYILVAILPISYYIWLKIFSFPLITRKPHELLLIITPEKLKIKKIKSRLYPFFSFCKGLYWFSDPFEDVDSNNQFHVYIEGVNQSLGDMSKDGTLKRRANKLDELTTNTEKINEISGHGVLLPRNIKVHLHRHYQIILDPISHKLKIIPTRMLLDSFSKQIRLYKQILLIHIRKLSQKLQITLCQNLLCMLITSIPITTVPILILLFSTVIY